MTMIALMSAILVFSAQNSFQKFEKLAGKFFPAICFQSFESKSLENFWKLFESKSLENFWKQIAGKILKAFWKQIAGKFLKANRWKICES